jgi:hypothetical protein
MAPDDFDEYIRFLLWQQAGQRVAHREALLRQYGEQPEFWADDLRRENEVSLAALAQPDYAEPIDLLESLRGPERLRAAQSLIRRYGELVSWWPLIVERAKVLAARSGSILSG